MNVIGLCGEENIEVNGIGHYICHKGCFVLVSNKDNPIELCKECRFALKKENEEKTGKKQEEPHETITRLCDMVAKLHTELYHAKNDIGALLFLNGNCEYCANGQVEKYCGAERWTCKLGDGIDCKPVWRGVVKESDEE